MLKDTGERFMPDWKGETALEHLHRYEFTLEFVAGKRVLDVASGEGYGSFRLASVAQSVIGVDVSEEAVEHARTRHLAPNLQFRHGSAAQLPLEDHSIDVAVSFETIEHLHEHEKMLAELARVLTPEGLLIISTPDKHFYTDQRNHQNPYHVKELYRPEFVQLLKRHFINSELWLQNTMHASAIVPEHSSTSANTTYTHDCSTGVTTRAESLNPLYLIALASNGALTTRPGPSTFEMQPPAFTQVEQELRTKHQQLEHEHREVLNVLERTMKDLVAAEREQRRLATALHNLSQPKLKSVLSNRARSFLKWKSTP